MTTVYTPTRCQNFFACWVRDNALVWAPAGWTFERVAIGQYRIFPDRVDVPDMLHSIAQAGLYGTMASSRVELPPWTARTFLVGADAGLHCFEIWPLDAEGNTDDSQFSLFVMVPG